MGFDAADYRGKPVIAIINTWSDINPCHTHFKQRVEDVKRGVWSAGGFPVEMPAMSLSEPFQKPTTMLYRNLLAMETEELLRSHPVDGAVLMGGCDKTTPGLLMGAASMDLPTLFLPAGPMLRGHWGGTTLGSGSDTWKYWADLRAGNITQEDWQEIENGIARSPGHCMTMGTASTMTSAVEALGVSLPGAASIPAADSRHAVMAAHTGRQIVDMVWNQITLSGIATHAAFRNAVTTVLAIGGSTNAVIHLIAMARRLGVELGLGDFEELGRRTPLLGNIRPSGAYLMEDFFYAGGLPALLNTLGGLLDTSVVTANGQTLGQNIAPGQGVQRRRHPPPGQPGGGLGHPGRAVRQPRPERGGDQTPGRRIPTAHPRRPAVVFTDYDDMAARIDDPDLDVDENSVLVLQNAGPQGAPGMPEWGQLPIPKKLLERGVRDMLRISDARMSGTSYGACVLHVAPESFIGGPLAFVHNGDIIELDVAAQKLSLQITDEELDERRADWQQPTPKYARGYGALYLQHITQADQGCDFDFLETGPPTPEPEIH